MFVGVELESPSPDPPERTLFKELGYRSPSSLSLHTASKSHTSPFLYPAPEPQLPRLSQMATLPTSEGAQTSVYVGGLAAESVANIYFGHPGGGVQLQAEVS